MTKQASKLAEKVAEFIKHNQIDTTKYTMDQIVLGYFEAQMVAIDEAAEIAKYWDSDFSAVCRYD